MKLVDNFRAVSKVLMGDGTSFCFWKDKWEIGNSCQSLMSKFPRLFSFAKEESISAAKVYAVEELHSLFHLPLCILAFEEMEQLKLLMDCNPVDNTPDKWIYYWGNNYLAAKFYKHIHSHILVPKVYKWIWKSCCTMKLKVFCLVTGSR